MPAFAGIPRKDLVSYTLDYYANETTPSKNFEMSTVTASSTLAPEEQQGAVSPVPETIPAETDAVVEKKERRLWQEEKLLKVKRFLKNVSPYLKVKEQFTDNILLDNDNEMSDFVTIADPGIEIKNKISKGGLDYRLVAGTELVSYVRNHAKDTQLPYGGGFVKYNAKNYGVSVTTNIYRRRATSGELEVYNEATNREFIDMWFFDYGSSFETSFKKLKWGLQYYHNYTVYQQDDYVSSNRKRNNLALVSSLQITPKTNLLFDYVHGWIDTIKSKPGRWTYNKYWWGVSSAFNKLSGSLKYGYRSTDPTSGQRKYAGPTVKMRFDYQQTPRLVYNLELVNGLGEANLLDEGTAKIHGVLLGCNYLPLFNKRLRFATGVGYKEQNSEPDTRDKYLYVTLKPEYKLKKWLTIGIGYLYGTRMSNIATNKYKNNLGDLELTAEF
ncbi:MAG: hypothetical protein WCI77_04280 [Candidatus Omnitrophota bacterium]